MAQVIVDLSMSLDGFVAGPNDGPDNPLGDGGERLFQWYFSGETEFVVPSGTMTFRLSPVSAEVFREGIRSVGVIVSGRRTFDIADGWGGRHPLDVPVLVVTHTPPQEWVARGGSAITFVTDGVESAIRQAKDIAGEKDVAVGSASIAQQCLRAGLLDEVHIDLAPVLLGGGVRLFDNLGATPVTLEQLRVVEAPHVTHLRYRVVK